MGFKDSPRGNQYKAVTIDLGEPSEDGFVALNSILRWSDKAVMMVTLDAAQGFTNYVPYTFEFVSKSKGPTK